MGGYGGGPIKLPQQRHNYAVGSPHRIVNMAEEELPSNVSGWKIEQKYSRGVLIGNWAEDRFGKVRF